MRFSRRFLACVLLASAARGEGAAAGAVPDIYSGLYGDTGFESLTFVNSVAGWDIFFNSGYTGNGRVVANVEAGLVWDGHEAFLRPSGSLPAVPLTLAGTGALGEVDYHATMVGHVMAGTGYVAGTDPAQFTYAGIGMAPMAQIWSGAIATGYSATNLGGFETTTESTVSVYQTFFQGINGVKPDAINSSWGGSDSAPEALAIDGLARQNPTVAFVASAGNGDEKAGTDPVTPAYVAQVSSPGSVYNGITVGSLGGAGFLTPSDFSSSGAVDFWNPVTLQTVYGVRSAVDIAAAGENLFLAAYLGATGSLGASTDPDIIAAIQDPSPTTLYFLNMSGTSFSAPTVAGAIVLLKDAAEDFLPGIDAANDTRVIKSVIMAGATETVGWDNGQAVGAGGVVETTQSLDAKTGAGSLNLTRTADVYLLAGTRDVADATVAGGGVAAITKAGWDFAPISLADSENSYVISNPFENPIELTVSLNWFAGSSFDNGTSTGSADSFADLNLEVWEVGSGGEFLSMVAKSSSIYNNSEFLRLDLPAGTYGIRITLAGFVYGSRPEEESYGLAWRAVPEPATLTLLVVFGGGLAWALARTRRTCANS